MKKTACQYKIVRFAPFAETEEFANVGIVLFEPQLGKLHFKLAKTRFRRVNQFFDLEDTEVYAGAIKGLQKDLQRLQHDLPRMNDKQGERVAKAVFADFTRFQTGLIHFSETRVIRASNLEQTTQNLFRHYVARDFHTQQYRENVLARELRETFKRYQLAHAYHEKDVDAGLIAVKMPFTHYEDEHLRGAIKPLAFDQKRVQKQVEHMDLWVDRIRHLLNAQIPGEALMLAFDEGSARDGEVRRYIEDRRKELEEYGVQTTRAADTEALVQFARERAQ